MIIPLVLVGYEVIIINSHPKHARRIIVNYHTSEQGKIPKRTK